MKKTLLSLGAFVAVLVAAVLIMQATITGPAQPGAAPPATTSAPTVLPVTTNPITATGTKPGLTLTDALAENNIDPTTKAALADRLQFTLTNTTTTPMTGLEVYYTMKDTTTGATEAYYQKLDGLTLTPGQGTTIYVDNGTGPGHYPENKYSLYRSSPNEVTINIEAAAPGYAPAQGTATKAQGTGEKTD
ncbi:hypothetical protein IG195_20790 (plasmid) [Arthrobacter sp. TES]|uniref:hypothetical protein n=1 Tax=Paenarthrobacter ureafaciens TaxID=37931 RepID=UPI000397B53E|nr:hypothetical protein [Paenarthrobacter ureafaciens]AOY74122.1 hypothetical protein ARZXY2_4623 [Arthrobacter sp. ZXY-2]ERI37986.1 hypothetical protein M707_08010 [Arthrobacter sp. AK-YN10]QOI65796.1 hypothetical protein IG195_20790 [Arthrobacter sp. TES]GLU61072.1 hypothetical protein Pure01_35850 [Paenarthrobacter ureafaciens]GLU65341.1 hypothetical protein Pure02_35910 [Paenarthrobacter ureafaciens]